mgnify:CR=1 FL=1
MEFAFLKQWPPPPESQNPSPFREAKPTSPRIRPFSPPCWKALAFPTLPDGKTQMWRTPCGYSPPTLSQKPPLRRRKYQRTRSGIPPTQRQWRKRNHGSLKPKPPETGRTPQSLSPEEQHLSTGNPSCCTAPPQDFHRSTFSFSESRTAFSFVNKRKSGFAPAGQAKTNKTEKASLSAEGKSRFVKFLCRADKISAPTKVRWLVEKLLSARGTPHP